MRLLPTLSFIAVVMSDFVHVSNNFQDRVGAGLSTLMGWLRHNIFLFNLHIFFVYF